MIIIPVLAFIFSIVSLRTLSRFYLNAIICIPMVSMCIPPFARCRLHAVAAGVSVTVAGRRDLMLQLLIQRLSALQPVVLVLLGERRRQQQRQQHGIPGEHTMHLGLNGRPEPRVISLPYL